MKYLKLLCLHLIIFLLGTKYLDAQVLRRPFLLELNIKGAKDKEVLKLAFDYKDLSNLHLVSDSCVINNGKAFFKGELIDPVALHIYCDDSIRYISSDVFFIESGNMKASFNIDSIDGKSIIVIGSKTNEEYLRSFHTALFQKKMEEWYDKVYQVPSSINGEQRDSLLSFLLNLKAQIYNERDSILYEDSKLYQNSLIPIWMIFRFMHQKGYSKYYDSILIKNKFTNLKIVKILKKKIETASEIAIGSQFPSLNLITIDSTRIKTNFSENKNSYSLIDFWYSHCGPCIAQFSQLKEIYSQYRTNGFEIHGISIDPEKYISNWKAVISKHEIQWKQYLDLTGVEAAKYQINYFPFNFLLDKSGKILAKNLSPTDLHKYLEKNIAR